MDFQLGTSVLKEESHISFIFFRDFNFSAIIDRKTGAEIVASKAKQAIITLFFNVFFEKDASASGKSSLSAKCAEGFSVRDHGQIRNKILHVFPVPLK